MELTQVDASLYNPDLAPIPAEKRSWGTYNYASLWVAMSVCIPTYMLASGLIAGGMNWMQAIATILLGNLIVLVPMLLNAHAGTRYGIPFPVFVRASFGVRGANIPAVLRALVACGWFGIQTWIGGQAIYSMLQIVWPGGRQSSRQQLDLLLRVLGDQYGRHLARHRDHQVSRRDWRAVHAGGRVASFVLDYAESGRTSARCCTRQSKFHTTSEFVRFFIPSLTGMVGFWATVALNIPDFTRYAKSQRAQMVGQALGLPAAMTLYSFIGVAVTSASAVIFGQPIWDPVRIARTIQSATGGTHRAGCAAPGNA